MARQPKVSVVMSVFNGETFLAEAIDSILIQSYRDFELLVVDDASTDGTAAILADYDDPRLRIVTNETNLGLTLSLNRVLAEARGELIARQDADDVSITDRLALQVEWLDRHPEVGVLGSELEIVDAEGKSRGSFGVATEHAEIVWRMFYGRVLAHPSVMFRAELVRAVAGYDPDVEVAQDLELWTRLVGRTCFANLSRPLVRYRTHSGAVSVRKGEAQQRSVLAARARLAEALLGRPVTAAELAALATTLAGSAHPRGMELAGVLIAALEAKGAVTSTEAEVLAADLKKRSLGTRLWGLLRWRLQALRRKLSVTPHDGKAHGTQRSSGSGVTVVVLTYFRPEGLNALLESLAAQELGELGLEVIICNNAPGRRLGGLRFRRRLEALANVKVIDSSYNWACSVRYAFAAMAKYETVLFLDDDFTLLDNSLIARMYERFQRLAPHDILSLWTTIWAEWDDTGFSTVSLTFMNDEVSEPVEVDTVGPGLSMFHRDTLLDPEVFGTIMSPPFPKVDDMAFGIVTSMKLGTRKYFMPCYGMLRSHKQTRTKALATRSGRYDDLHAYYKQVLAEGFEPLLVRQARDCPGESTVEQKLARRLPPQRFRW
ncbi:glycosyltransferase [Pelagibius litoralis]|uniref:Glycosyltransferase n=1 Tax=Pelagibius litoralis TaxID=374515 RepID=A0A967C7J5_9PROT|nr:glycosyltransferase [Pelagibius litoralis]NIA69071.1 glycosyltransferase [Pelagibius litoralis]